MEVIAILLVILLIALSAFMLYREFQHVSVRVVRLEESNEQKKASLLKLEERMKKLEQANRKRMPWEALEKLLNARAALNREKEDRKIGIDLIENAESWIEEVMAEGTKRGEE